MENLLGGVSEAQANRHCQIRNGKTHHLKNIMKPIKLMLTAVSLLATIALAVPAAAEDTDQKKLTAEVKAALKDFQAADGSLKALFKKAAGYAVFPTAGKGGFIVGGAHGTGQVYAGGKLLGTAKMTQVTVGAQIGGQAFAELIFFETKEALAKFKAGGYSMSAQVSAVAAAEGASKNAKYVEGVMVFTKAKSGLMAEATVGGQKFSFEPIDKK
jgi:lipid-binding SYLF domain-containing protein